MDSFGGSDTGTLSHILHVSFLKPVSTSRANSKCGFSNPHLLHTDFGTLTLGTTGSVGFAVSLGPPFLQALQNRFLCGKNGLLIKSSIGFSRVQATQTFI